MEPCDILYIPRLYDLGKPVKIIIVVIIKVCQRMPGTHYACPNLA